MKVVVFVSSLAGLHPRPNVPRAVLADKETLYQQPSASPARSEFKKGKLAATSLQTLDSTIGPKSSDKNITRDTKQQLSKDSSYPDVYEAEIDL